MLRHESKRGGTRPLKGGLVRGIRDGIVLSRGLAQDAAIMKRRKLPTATHQLIGYAISCMDPKTRETLSRIYREDGYGVREALADVFDEGSRDGAGDSLMPLVVCALDVMRTHHVVLPDEAFARDDRAALDEFTDAFGEACERAIASGVQPPYDQVFDAGFGPQLLGTFHSAPGPMAFCVPRYMVDNWRAIGDATLSYKTLSIFMRLTDPWTETWYDRVTFAKASADSQNMFELERTLFGIQAG